MILLIFPEGSLASSVITTVWVGVFVVCFFNLRFGWVLSGLVVPGYIVPLLIAKPVAAVVVILETALTYLIVWLFSEKLSGGRTWSSVFGRDRFMALILASVAVRLSMDGLLLPLLNDWMLSELNTGFDWRDNLYSYGLVVVALFANQLWKPGFVRGMASSLIIIGITYLIVRYGLMIFTNFRISGVTYLYEDFASSILASPKAYIILIVTCFIASRMNVRYGWDFSGILIPALLALQWYQPLKIMTSFLEAGVIYFLASMIMKRPFLANSTMEGARKLLLFFNVSFAYKLVLGHALTAAGVDYRITDFYGFGYLLPTLLAIKAYDKNIVARLTRTTMQVSFVGAGIGTVLGLILAFLLPGETAAESGSAARVHRSKLDAAAYVARAVGNAHVSKATGGGGEMDPVEADSFQRAVDILHNTGDVAGAARVLSLTDYRIVQLADGTNAIWGERGAARGFFLFNPAATRDLIVAVPDPTRAQGLGLAGLGFFGQQRAKWLVVGSAPESKTGSDGDPFAIFSRTARLPVAQVEGVSGGKAAGPAVLLSGSVAPAMDLAAVRSSMSSVRFRFVRNTQGSATADMARLQLDPEAIRELIGRPVRLESSSLGSLLQRDMLPRPQPASPLAARDLAYLQEEVIEPMIQASANDELPQSLAASTAARAAGYDLFLFKDPAGASHLGLRSAIGGRGVILFKVAPPAVGEVVQVAGAQEPMDRRILSANSQDYRLILDVAARFWNATAAKAFLMAPSTEELSNPAGSVTGLALQSLVRLYGERPVTVLQVRPFPFIPKSEQPFPRYLIATDRLEVSQGLGHQLVEIAGRTGYPARLVDRSQVTAGFEIAPSNHLRYLMQSGANKRLAVLWVGAGAGASAAQ